MVVDDEQVAALKDAPLELKLKIMLRNWSYPEFLRGPLITTLPSLLNGEANTYKRLKALELVGKA